MKPKPHKSEDLQPHKFAEFFPPMTEVEFQALKANIELVGQQDDILLYEGKILDGRHRYRVMTELGKEPRTQTFNGTDAQAMERVYSKALTRNLTDSQKCCIAAEFKEEDDKAAKARMLCGGRDKIPEANKGRSRDLAGRRFGVNGKYVDIAYTLKKNSPKLFEDVKCGKLTISAAKQAFTKTRRRKELAKFKSLPLDEKSCKLMHGDCEERLSEIPAASVRVVMTDPPYGLRKKYDSDPTGDALKESDFLDWCDRWLAECKRVLTVDGSIFVMMRAKYAAPLEMRMRGMGLHRRNVIYWWENNPENQKGNFSDAVRPILYFTKSATDFIFNDDVRIPSRRNEIGDKRAIAHGKLPDNVWIDGRIPGNSLERVSFPDAPPQLPVQIPQTCILVASNPGDTILDPFNGNGTAGVAALLNSRKYIGIDQSKKYIEQSREWIGKAMASVKGASA